MGIRFLFFLALVLAGNSLIVPLAALGQVPMSEGIGGVYWKVPWIKKFVLGVKLTNQGYEVIIIKVLIEYIYVSLLCVLCLCGYSTCMSLATSAL